MLPLSKRLGPPPSKAQIIDSITTDAWGGIVALIQTLVSTGAFGQHFPEMCPDGYGPAGTDEQSFRLALKAEVPDIIWPLKTEVGERWEREPWAPETLTALDLIQFCYQSVAEPIQEGYHSYFGHYHLSFDKESGQDLYREKINRIFQRNGIAFVLKKDGNIKRIIPKEFKNIISSPIRTGDSVLDSMIDDAQKKFLNPDTKVRKEAIERLWDCWERTKSLENPNNKKKSVYALLDKASPDPDIRLMLEEEARKLTDIGNKFHIRHSEVAQIVISDSGIIDYLFYRLIAFVQMLLLSR